MTWWISVCSPFAAVQMQKLDTPVWSNEINPEKRTACRGKRPWMIRESAKMTRDREPHLKAVHYFKTEHAFSRNECCDLWYVTVTRQVRQHMLHLFTQLHTTLPFCGLKALSWYFLSLDNFDKASAVNWTSCVSIKAELRRMAFVAPYETRSLTHTQRPSDEDHNLGNPLWNGVCFSAPWEESAFIVLGSSHYMCATSFSDPCFITECVFQHRDLCHIVRKALSHPETVYHTLIIKSETSIFQSSCSCVCW